MARRERYEVGMRTRNREFKKQESRETREEFRVEREEERVNERMGERELGIEIFGGIKVILQIPLTA